MFLNNFKKINNKSVLRLTAEKFQNSSSIDKFIVISHKNYFEESLKEVQDLSKFISVVMGGSSRQQSVNNGLKFLRETKK